MGEFDEGLHGDSSSSAPRPVPLVKPFPGIREPIFCDHSCYIKYIKENVEPEDKEVWVCEGCKSTNYIDNVFRRGGVKLEFKIYSEEYHYFCPGGECDVSYNIIHDVKPDIPFVPTPKGERRRCLAVMARLAQLENRQ